MRRPNEDLPTRGHARVAFRKAECPYCGSKGQIEGEAVEITNDTAAQDQNCVVCGNTWTAYYDLCAVRYYSKAGDGDWIDGLYTRKREGR